MLSPSLSPFSVEDHYLCVGDHCSIILAFYFIHHMTNWVPFAVLVACKGF